MSEIYLFLILLALIGVVVAISKILAEFDRRRDARKRLEEFEEKYPPKNSPG